MKRTELKRKTPLKAKTVLKATTKLKIKSPKQIAIDALWRSVTMAKWLELDCRSQWTGKPIDVFVGHHIIKRSQGGEHTIDNCYVCEPWYHINEIHLFDIDVTQYPNREAWIKSKGEL